MLRFARMVITIFCLLGMAYIVTVTRLQNPTLTEMQLFIVFWPNWLVMIMFAGIAYLMLTARDLQ